MDELRLTPCLMPHGRLLLAPSDEGPELEPALARLRQAFARGAGHGLLRLGAAELGQVLPPVFAYWRGLGSRHVTALCTRPAPRLEGGLTYRPGLDRAPAQPLRHGHSRVREGDRILTVDETRQCEAR